MAVYHRDFAEGNARMTLRERAEVAAFLATQGMDFPPNSPEQTAHWWAAAKLLAPIHTREADPNPLHNAIEIASWDS